MFVVLQLRKRLQHHLDPFQKPVFAEHLPDGAPVPLRPRDFPHERRVHEPHPEPQRLGVAVHVHVRVRGGRRVALARAVRVADGAERLREGVKVRHGRALNETRRSERGLTSVWGGGEGEAGLLLSRGGGGGEGVLDPKLGVPKMA